MLNDSNLSNSSGCPCVTIMLYAWHLPILPDPYVVFSLDPQRVLIKIVPIYLGFNVDEIPAITASSGPVVVVEKNVGESIIMSMQIPTLPCVVYDGNTSSVSCTLSGDSAVSLSMTQILQEHLFKVAPETSNQVDMICTSNTPNSADKTVHDSFQAGIDAYNDGNFFVAGTHFEQLIRSSVKNTSLARDSQLIVNNALFNMASLCHMFGYPSVAMGFVHDSLTRSGLHLSNMDMTHINGDDDRSRNESEDMIAHAFLWTLANTTLESHESRGCATSTMPLTQLAMRIYADLHRSTGSKMALHKLNTLKGVSLSNIVALSNNPDYAKCLYDDMAASFENKLVNCLNYQAPWIMHKEIVRLLSSTARGGSTSSTSAVLSPLVLLDLGCGSGLIGRIFHNLVKGISLETPDIGMEPTPPVTAVTDALPDTGAALSTVTAAVADPTACASSVSTLADTSSIPTAQEQFEAVIAGLCRRHPGDASGVTCSGSGGGGNLVGVDISPAMVRIAAAHPWCYDHTYALDVREALSIVERTMHNESRQLTYGGDNDGVVDLVIAADTFIYLGLLGEIFAKVKTILRRHGLFCFTIENLDVSPMKRAHANSSTSDSDIADDMDDACSEDLPFEPISCSRSNMHPLSLNDALQLLTSARFAHSTSYIHALCRMYSFTIVQDIDIVLRQEGSVPLAGKIYILSVQ